MDTIDNIDQYPIHSVTSTIKDPECKRKRSQSILKQEQEFDLKDIVDVQPVALQEIVARSRVCGITRRRTYMQMQTYRVQFEFIDDEKF
ncbi:MAG: hypothetical protein EZS28_026148 [Streblomastix strix]|uniref:Uncharacterized protein n=1 Tax=Streblomastix strix TaxID=222440 RepID=A0A5J4V5Y7_9EUKA|nr:MAG: hypothetical protein EZS28_026148 [Streblomastix strix]